MLHVGTLLQLLGQRISGLRLSGDSAVDLAGDVGLKRQQMMYVELRARIRRHQKITKFLHDLEAAMSTMVLVQFSISMFCLCMDLYQQIQIEDALTALQYAMTMPFHSIQIYFYCWTADVITQQGEAMCLTGLQQPLGERWYHLPESAHNRIVVVCRVEAGEALSLAAYSSHWVGAGAVFQRALSIVMARAQKPLLITAGHLYPVNTAAFVALMKASYSHYTLLRQLDSS
ncbi:odorant receptor Or2-like [Schistocerca serialis cubense]|uniref:odorant receptor Or2-like n=1 Tax=Schistocerca serialis cubense TaxID=2023355 RepID=UPI00214F2674|nr:odorant receptor Or2-like [Schistocerca serialis cubense]